jgi:hypothetical protein
MKCRCSLRKEEKNDIYIIFRYEETHKWTEVLLNDKWLHINKGIQQKKTVAPRIKD